MQIYKLPMDNLGCDEFEISFKDMCLIIRYEHGYENISKWSSVKFKDTISYSFVSEPLSEISKEYYNSIYQDEIDSFTKETLKKIGDITESFANYRMYIENVGLFSAVSTGYEVI